MTLHYKIICTTLHYSTPSGSCLILLRGACSEGGSITEGGYDIRGRALGGGRVPLVSAKLIQGLCVEDFRGGDDCDGLRLPFEDIDSCELRSRGPTETGGGAGGDIDRGTCVFLFTISSTLNSCSSSTTVVRPLRTSRTYASDSRASRFLCLTSLSVSGSVDPSSCNKTSTIHSTESPSFRCNDLPSATSFSTANRVFGSHAGRASGGLSSNNWNEDGWFAGTLKDAARSGRFRLDKNSVAHIVKTRFHSL